MQLVCLGSIADRNGGDFSDSCIEINVLGWGIAPDSADINGERVKRVYCDLASSDNYLDVF